MASRGRSGVPGGGARSRKAFAYARAGPGGSAPPAELQLAAAAAHARLNGFDQIEEVVDDGVPGSVQPFARPGMRPALMTLSSGGAAALSVSGIDRIACSAGIVMLLADCARSDGWRLLVPGADVDTSTPEGRFAVRMLCGLAQLGRDTAGAGGFEVPPPAGAGEPSRKPTDAGAAGSPVDEPDGGLSYLDSWKRALAEHAEGRSSAEIAAGFNDDGVPLPGGRRNRDVREWTKKAVEAMVRWPEGMGLMERAKSERAQGRTLAQIARGLNDDGLPTRTGRQWSAGTLSGMLSRERRS